MTKRRPSRIRSRRPKPTYGAATRLARIIIGLWSRPFGWSLNAICNELAISERTLLRYLAVCRKELVDRFGRPLIEIARRGERRIVRFADHRTPPDSNPFRVVSLYFTLATLRSLEGTVIKESVEDLWERTYRMLRPDEQSRIVNFDRKFYAVSYTPKVYQKHDENIDMILRALVDQNRVKVDYGGVEGEGRTHNFDPYTLLAYRGGLYLMGLSDVYRQVIYLAVERIRKMDWILSLDGGKEHFVYPASYGPEKYFDGVFGLIDGPPTAVELLLLGTSEALFRSRAIHPTQRFHERADGKTILIMTVRGTTELANWIVSMGQWVKVLRPKALQDEVAKIHREAAHLYRHTR